jgi:hypothetical protein
MEYKKYIFLKDVFLVKRLFFSADYLPKLSPFREAIAAVDRLVPTGPERNLGFLAAGGADGRKHFSVIRSSAVSLGSAAAFAAGGLVSKSLLSEKILLFGGKNKRIAAILTYEGLILVHVLNLRLKKLCSCH